MLNRILGQKNSVKRVIMTFSLCFILVTMLFGGMILIQSHMAVRKYDEIIQNIVSIEESKSLLGQMKLSARKYAEAHNDRDYAYVQESRTALKSHLDVIRKISRDSSSQAAMENIDVLLANADRQMMYMRNGEGTERTLPQVETQYDNILYLLNRVQNLEVTSAAEVYPQLSASMNALTRVAAVTLVLMLLASIAFSADFHKRVYDPIRQLVRGVDAVSKGDFQSPDIEIGSSDEMEYLASAVNEMKRELSHLIAAREEKLKAERLLKETQFLALQSQVNPHFLFNTLGMATAVALLEGADKTLGIIESIAYMLRYSLQAMKTDVTLRDEMRMVETYLFLQNQRFGDRITFCMEVDENLPDVPVPGMTVQPIVENAMIHGCEKLDSGGWIKVGCHLDPEGKEAVVTVENNGGVLSEKQIQAFYEGGQVPHAGKTTGIGLVNVRERMQFFYDRSGLMDCRRADGNTNVVILRYPMDGRQ